MKKILILLTIALVQTLTAQRLIQAPTDPLVAKNVENQKKWVDSILQNMSIDQKIGQLFMIQAYSNKGKKHQDFINNMIRKYHVGNLIFMQGTPEKQVRLNNEYQAISKVPLLIGFDGEWGLDMRLKNTYRFPWNMTLGAIDNDELLTATGKRIGQHCKRVGIHINFAPVVDINTNPKNPIIGNRSFGENKQNVTRKAIAFTKGMQSVGVLANAKHFPGHGDTATDSHLTLPTVNFDKFRLDSVELYPYKKMFRQGLASVMTAHLSIPALEPNEKLPTSLSKKVVTTLLQEELGFKGLVITDGLNMKGAANYATAADINIAAILAGNDMLLIPQDVPGTIRLIKDALVAGNLSQARLHKSVEKILKAKYLVGLHKYKSVDTENIASDINSPYDEVLHRKLIKNAITVVKNNEAVLPIKNLKDKKIAYVSLGDAKGDSFVSMLKNYTNVEVVSAKNITVLLQKLQKYNLVVVGFHKSNKNPWKGYQFSNKNMIWLQEIAKNKKVILDVFTSPYSLLKIPSFENIEGVVVSYQNSVLSQELSAQALFGAFDLKGKLPVSINENIKEGTGVFVKGINVLQYTIPEEAGVSSEKLSIIDKRIDTILMKRMAPGGQIFVAKNGKVIYNKSFGHHTSLKRMPVKSSDIYDVASLTKILASLPMIMKAEEEQKISLYSNLGDVLPRYKNSNKDTVLLKEILSHYGRLRSWIPFYLQTKDSETGKNSAKYYRKKRTADFNIKVAKNLYLKNTYKDSIYKHIVDAKQRKKPGYKYSDLGYYMFKEILELKYKQPLNKLVEEFFYSPLGANRTTYLPLEKFKKSDIIPTERDNYYRNQLVHGYVHDMGAAMIGGVGGHAGLFSNANDIGKIMQLFLQGGNYGDTQYLASETIDKFNKRHYENRKVRRGLGFDKPQLNPRVKATCGCVSDKSFGHSGFTGTYTWVDPATDVVYVFLSNRVYPTMRNRKLIKSNIRTKIQKDIQDAILMVE
ncbi:serine hydrolase [Tenacibaculum finnmarkense]|uniref:glycoside hydrolase family 3 N-terminal domain-containing protein n=1 Tax=Tenacibaculum finnmarkense TaxID=2781243 RepID=UPI001EFB74F8|nr:glycoside hydrolase family 3 N-terminal domain-containing protein [Tenacibaculum finnmarkense]MCG8804093.1 serine hydrolase [Tenacibaculum finnmarkense]MCG8856167.1 serine hydrolase [Tenacibaculum finnmarkense]